MPGIDPPKLARLQEIPVCEKCCGLEHLFSFHSGMKPRLSGRRGRGGEKKKKNYFFFFSFFLGWLLLRRDSLTQYRCPHHRAGESVLSQQPLIFSLCSSSRVGQGLG